MARQRGIIKLKGKIGDVSFYESDGQSLARLKGGVEKDRIEKDPNFKRTRENMKEFGGAAKVGKSFRMGLVSVIKAFGNRYIVARVVKLMKAINARGPGDRGKRTFEIVVNKDLFEGFEFNETDVLGSVFNAPYTITANAARNEITLDIPDFDADSFITAPEGATHFRIVSAISVLSDFVYNTTSNAYEAADPTVNEEGIVVKSSEISIDGLVGSATTLVNTLPGGPTIPATAGVLACVGIEFLQELNGSFYLLSSGNAMKIEEIF